MCFDPLDLAVLSVSELHSRKASPRMPQTIPLPPAGPWETLATVGLRQACLSPCMSHLGEGRPGSCHRTASNPFASEVSSRVMALPSVHPGWLQGPPNFSSQRPHLCPIHFPETSVIKKSDRVPVLQPSGGFPGNPKSLSGSADPSSPSRQVYPCCLPRQSHGLSPHCRTLLRSPPCHFGSLCHTRHHRAVCSWLVSPSGPQAPRAALMWVWFVLCLQPLKPRLAGGRCPSKACGVNR